MKEFNREENNEIRGALHVIRALILLDILKNHPEREERERLCRALQNGSKIRYLINDFQWQELFDEKDFLELLYMATMYSFNKEIQKALMVVCKHLPEEMKKAGEKYPEIGLYLFVFGQGKS
ncbi:MAG: hypothetical protein PHT40_02870 [Patescibacteria group bacterium]|nr:hypothetical protein [Patescibacteria group bacterium]